MNADMDVVSSAMFWVGALFVLTPLVFAGTVLAIWRYTQKREREAAGGQAPGESLPSPRT